MFSTTPEIIEGTGHTVIMIVDPKETAGYFSIVPNESYQPQNSIDISMSNHPVFKAAYPYQTDILALPVTNVDTASNWYSKHFGMSEVERTSTPVPTVILERDGIQIGFAANGGDASQDGAAILVNNIQGMKEELESTGLKTGDFRIDERDGKKFQVFFVVAPDELCYYFHQAI